MSVIHREFMFGFSRFVENLRHSLICPEISLLSMNTYPFRGGFGVATAVELTKNISEPDISKILLMVQKSDGNAPVEVSSFSHYLQGFKNIPSGFLGVLTQQDFRRFIYYNILSLRGRFDLSQASESGKNVLQGQLFPGDSPPGKFWSLGVLGSWQTASFQGYVSFKEGKHKKELWLDMLSFKPGTKIHG